VYVHVCVVRACGRWWACGGEVIKRILFSNTRCSNNTFKAKATAASCPTLLVSQITSVVLSPDKAKQIAPRCVALRVCDEQAKLAAGVRMARSPSACPPRYHQRWARKSRGALSITNAHGRKHGDDARGKGERQSVPTRAKPPRRRKRERGTINHITSHALLQWCET
jgi:hypothetical protein